MKIERKKVSMQVFDHIKKMIKEEQLRPGDRLPSESHFTEMFGVSRTPVREALSVLEASGLIASKQGGASIIQPTSVSNLLEETQYEFINPEDVINLLETRMIVESGAAYYAAKRRTAKEVQDIYEALKLVCLAQQQEQIGYKEDINFHQAIVRASHNPVLIQTMENVSFLYEKAVKYSLSQNIGWEEKQNQIIEEHEMIFQAIEMQNPDQAQEVMNKHLAGAKEKLIAALPLQLTKRSES
ncbi:GntR family transcriptional regulator, transcriptional repressor for pyruvate dehydrogenase complex [Marinococcus luteus]|uniref:GntR family transcriptional regulator, transcriptional repressor for pyruvate dehydrogenase complex n=1 Tax=Marinococcus luteus TaxID=1122204 RepID=A0A1H2QNB1_9BACI|nr:FadR/GntR family transcriptional regulator [Marinococcus luteus]SDW08656.1 GntR family transcriptional regulator, transcriptional repressor for pyruvate dehydrogenase complex [Marinococcus luteus]